MSITAAFYRSPFSSDRKQQEWISAGNLEWLLIVFGEIVQSLMRNFTVLFAVHGIKWTCSNGNSSSGFSVEQLVQQILDSHQTKPQPRTHNCLCTGTLGESLGRAQGDSASSSLGEEFVVEVIKMLCHETLGHNELRVERRSPEHKTTQLELLGKVSMLSNKCSPYMSCSKRYILFFMWKFCYQSLKT